MAQYTIQIKNLMMREMIAEELKRNNIPTTIYYKKPLHMQEAFAGGHKEYTDCCNSIKLSETVISLPMHI